MRGVWPVWEESEGQLHYDILSVCKVSSHFVNSHLVNVDRVEIDKLGIDKVES